MLSRFTFAKLIVTDILVVINSVYNMELYGQESDRIVSVQNSDLSDTSVNGLDHDYEEADEEDEELCQRTREAIDQLMSLHLRPTNIVKCLSQKSDIVVPSKERVLDYVNKQLKHRILSAKKTVNEKPEISLLELGKWLAEHSKVPENEHKPYVISYSLNWGSSPNFSFAITTKHLLKFIVQAKNLVADTTKKLTWQSCSVLVIGTTARSNIFYPICLGVSSTESKRDFEMIFKNLKDNVLSLHSHCMKPSVLVCDGTSNIQDAFRAVFGPEPVIRVCWIVVKDNVETKVEELVERTCQKQLLDDFYLLQWPQKEGDFETLLQAFLTRYANHKDFLAYFKQEWLEKNSNWHFRAAKPEHAKDNNEALSIFIQNIKDNIKLQNLPLSVFLEVASSLVNKWSKSNTLESYSAVPIEFDDWKEAIEIVDTVGSIHFTNPVTNDNCYFHSPDSAELAVQLPSGDLFEDLKTILLRYRKYALTSMPVQIEKWMESSCTCRDYFRKGRCKHIIALALKLKYVMIPPEINGILSQQMNAEKPGLIVP